MTSFADRFKDKAQIVGKTGEGAMLVVQSKPPPAPSSSNANATPRTPPLSGNRAQRSILPSSDGQRAVNSSNSNYRDHVRGLSHNAGGSSAELQMGHSARDRGAAYAAGAGAGRSRSNQPSRPNALSEQPHGPMLFGQNKYRNKEQFSPKLPDADAPPRPEPTYVPYTVADWRQNKDNLAVVKGGVGRLASDTDEQRLYRALRGRMKEFGNETEAINKVALLPENLPRPPKPLTPPPTEEFLEKTNRRQKAVEFAKNVPKPRVAPKMVDSTAAGGGNGDDDDELFVFSDERRQKEEQLANLEEQHRRDQDAIAAMKKRFAMQ